MPYHDTIAYTGQGGAVYACPCGYVRLVARDGATRLMAGGDLTALHRGSTMPGISLGAGITKAAIDGDTRQWIDDLLSGGTHAN